MGARDSFESVTKVMQAFAGLRTWRQADLARRVGLEPRALRKLLLSLWSSGMPLEKEEEHPHVYWSVPQHWYPGGVFFDLEDWDVLVDAVLRISDKPKRSKLLSRLLTGRRIVGASEGGVERLQQVVVGVPMAQHEQEAALLVQKSVLEGAGLGIHYYSVSRGQLGWRTVSAQRLLVEPHARLVAFCHKNQCLRWFRLDNIQKAQVESGQSRVDVADSEVDAFIAASPDGYNDGRSDDFAFIVRPPASAWVRGNLLPGMQATDAPDQAIRVVTRGGAIVVARFIAGLGGDAIAEGAQLRALVHQLAQGAAEAHA